jgi:hypothetical protein
LGFENTIAMFGRSNNLYALDGTTIEIDEFVTLIEKYEDKSRLGMWVIKKWDIRAWGLDSCDSE